MKPRVFTEKLGNHPQFPFLQQANGVSTRAAFLKAVKDPANRKTYQKEFSVFDDLLKNVGFAKGYRELRLGDIENLYINPGTTGNLGFFNKENGYIYVRLNPEGEGDDGIAAWRITGPGGCYFYVLHTCGNAFFANNYDGSGSGCCREITVKAQTDSPFAAAQPRSRPLQVSIRFYQARIIAGKHNSDTAYRLIRSIDTTTLVYDSASPGGKRFERRVITKFLLCRDTVLSVRIPVVADTAEGYALIRDTLADTTFVREYSGIPDCHRKWEIAVDGGVSFNSIPRYDNTSEHTRTNGAQPAGELAVSRIFSHWFQAGIVASWVTLSYQDDLPYAGSTPNTYNTIYPAKPLVPIQLFGKATIGGPAGWQSTIALTGGFSMPVGHGQIRDNGATLAQTPSLKGGPTAGLRVGIAYFFNCSLGVGLTTGGQYVDNKGATMPYHLIALPVTLGLRFRF